MSRDGRLRSRSSHLGGLFSQERVHARGDAGASNFGVLPPSRIPRLRTHPQPLPPQDFPRVWAPDPSLGDASVDPERRTRVDNQCAEGGVKDDRRSALRVRQASVSERLGVPGVGRPSSSDRLQAGRGRFSSRCKRKCGRAFHWAGAFRLSFTGGVGASVGPSRRPLHAPLCSFPCHPAAPFFCLSGRSEGENRNVTNRVL